MRYSESQFSRLLNARHHARDEREASTLCSVKCGAGAQTVCKHESDTVGRRTRGGLEQWIIDDLRIKVALTGLRLIRNAVRLNLSPRLPRS